MWCVLFFSRVPPSRHSSRTNPEFQLEVELLSRLSTVAPHSELRYCFDSPAVALPCSPTRFRHGIAMSDQNALGWADQASSPAAVKTYGDYETARLRLLMQPLGVMG